MRLQDATGFFAVFGAVTVIVGGYFTLSGKAIVGLRSLATRLVYGTGARWIGVAYILGGVSLIAAWMVDITTANASTWPDVLIAFGIAVVLTASVVGYVVSRWGMM